MRLRRPRWPVEFSPSADPARLRLLSLIATRPEVCSCDLERPLAKSQATISHHTKVIAAASLIAGEKRGRRTWWRLAPKRVAAVRKALGGCAAHSMGSPH
ncbi:MAG: ArsR/SmtB family transcription factor [Acidimicrobiales bacterium]